MYLAKGADGGFLIWVAAVQSAAVASISNISCGTASRVTPSRASQAPRLRAQSVIPARQSVAGLRPICREDIELNNISKVHIGSPKDRLKVVECADDLFAHMLRM